MKPFRVAVLAAACAAALPALAQTAGSGGAAAPGASGGLTAPAAPSAASPTVPSSPGSISNPSLGTSTPSFGNTNPSFGTPPAGTTGGIADSSTSVAAQAQQRRQLALQQCQGMAGSAQTDCVRAADDAFARETGSATLAQGGVAGNTRTTPDISPTPRDSIMR
jgi:hypothetical protein